MKAKDLKFRALIKTDGASGIITLGESRAILIEADALGTLRKELVDNLGIDVAKGILIRYGHRCGRADALRLQGRYPWQSEMEWLLADLKMHALEGVVKVESEAVNIDRQRGTFFMKGVWKNSFEAEQHVKFFGRSDIPVCWSLSGYASGYASAFFGKEIICIETECMGRGDEVCRFELRCAEEWGAEAAKIKHYYNGHNFKLRFNECLECIGSLSSQLMEMVEPRGYLESVLKNSLEAIITTDESGIIQFYSKGAEALCGYTAEQVIGKHVSILYASGVGETNALLETLREKGRIQNYETEFLTKNGSKVPVNASVSLIRDRLEKVIGLLHIVWDLREVRRLINELAQRDVFLANILLDSADAIITLDMHDVITSWNKGAEAIYGYDEAEVLGKSLDILLPEDLKASHELAKLSEQLRRDGIVRNYQTERMTKDGRRITVLLTRTAIRNDRGEVVGASAVVKDITRIKGMERQLIRAEHFAMLGELAASLAHEIKNPLGAIKGAVEVIRDEMAGGNPHKEVLQDVIHEVERIDKAVRDLLSYARPREPEFGEVDLEALLNRIVSLVRKQIREKNIKLDLSESKSTTPIWADASQLEQLFMNLILNSIQAIDRAGWIKISVDGHNEQGVEVLISDSGRGIPKEIKDKVFQPFFTTKTEGSGLGLAICQRIVTDHGGFIDLKSDPGSGTAVRIWLPAIPSFQFVDKSGKGVK